MISLPLDGPLNRARFERVADGLAATTAASLPWSTSATGIFAGLWLLVLLPTLEPGPVLRTLKQPAAYLPIALVALAVCGLAWGPAPGSERLNGLAQYAKLLAIPALFVQFVRSDNGKWPLMAFFVSALVLMIYSWLSLVIPALPSRGYPRGVPLKDYVIQSEIFAICALVLFERAVVASREARWRAVALMSALALAFLLNVIFVATARTTLVIMAVVLVLLGLRHFSRMQLAVFFAAIAGCAAVAWLSSPYLQHRLVEIRQDLASDRNADTSTGARLYFWRKSVDFINEAPVLGHGTGSMRDTFRRNSPHPAQEAASNPHNQIFAVGIQLGVIGILALAAMWGVHWWLFTGAGFAEWVGLVIVAQNVVGSLFNSHLFDFTQGWLYVIGVGVAGGMVLRRRLKT